MRAAAPARSLEAFRVEACRACLGALLVVLQARQAASWEALRSDWSFATVVVCNIGYLIVALSPRGTHRPCWCFSARVFPKLAFILQLAAQGSPAATAGWFNETCWQRRWAWRAAADVFVACGEFHTALLVRAVSVDLVCSGLVWGAYFAYAGVAPAPTALAYLLLRMALCACVICCQLRGDFSWVKGLLDWPRRLRAPEAAPPPVAVKADVLAEALLAHTPVYSSLLACNDPALLSKIAAASGSNLEAVAPERLSESETPSSGLCTPLGSGLLTPGGGPSGTTEAYDLARRLVSSANSMGMAGGSGGLAGGVGAYQSATRKVRVSVKIPDREPEDLRPGWESDMQFRGQRDDALVLFTYMRRGCIQLVLDVVVPAGSAHASGGGASALPSQPGQARPQRDLLPRRSSGSHSGPDGRTSGGRASGKAGGHSSGGSSACDSGTSVRSCTRVAGVPRDGPGAAEGLYTGDSASDASAGADADGYVERSSSSSASLKSLALTPESIMRVMGRSGALSTGRLAVMQVGSAVSLVRLSGDGEDGPAEPVPEPVPNVHVWPQMVCTQGGWFGSRDSAVVVSCRWKERPAGCVADDADEGGGARGRPAPAAARPPPPLQLSARQAGSFLLVQALAPREEVPRSLSGSAVAAAVNGMSAPEPQHGRGASVHVGSQGCRLAFAPTQHEGLVCVELSRGGVHSPESASVLLVSSPAVAGEMAQLAASAAADAEATAVVQSVTSDFGTFLDLASEFDKGPSKSAEPPCVVWKLPPRGPPSAAHVWLPTAPAASSPSSRHSPAEAEAGCGTTLEGCPGEGMDGDEGRHHRLRQERLRSQASVCAAMGFGLLRFFLANGFASCALHVLDVMERRLGLPAAMLGAAACDDGLTPLHHAGRSGARTVAALACWLEARGVAPGWSRPAGDAPSGLTPLHLVAAALPPAGGAAAAALLVRWPAAQLAWGRGSGTLRASPADLAALAAGPTAATAWARAAALASSLGVSAAWRGAEAVARAVVPAAWRKALCQFVTPSLAFALPELEAAYADWASRRAALIDNCYVFLLVGYCAVAIAQHGRSFVREETVGLAILALRCGLHAFSLLPRRTLLALAGTAPQPEAASRKPAGQRLHATRGAEAEAPPAAQHGWRARVVTCLSSREGRALVHDTCRLFIMAAITIGLVPLPRTWGRIPHMYLDIVFTAGIRPLAMQMRVGTSVLLSILAFAGEVPLIALAILPGSGPTTHASQAWLLAACALRSTSLHLLATVFTVRLQASARQRFLVEEAARRRQGVTGGSKGG